MKVEKMNGETLNITKNNIEKLKEIFPDIFTEGKIDFEALKENLGEDIETENEKYYFSWNGKEQAKKIAREPSKGTLRPAKEDSKDWDNTENLYIEGDNLEVLKLLQKSYYEQVKMIYIDPPYNTGNDFIYKNNFHDNLKNYLELTNQLHETGFKLKTNYETNGRYHSDWVSMMYSRLKLARNLLKDTGVITIAIDHYELSNLIKISNEIFGEYNQLGIVAVVHKPEGRNQAKFFGTSHEYMLFYAKSKEKCNFNKVILDDEILKQYKYKDDLGKYKLKNFIRMTDGKYSLRENKPNFYYPIYVSKDLKDLSVDKKEDYYKIYPITESGQERTWKTTLETTKERIENKVLISKLINNSIIIYEKLYENQVIKTHWIEKKYHAYHFGTKIVDGLLESKTFDFPKSLPLILDTIKLITSSNDIILDFFSGSATTAHAVMKLNAEDGGNRKYIMVQLPEKTDEKSEAFKNGYKNICEIGKERIRRAGEQVKEELETENQQLKLGEEPKKVPDIGFKVFKLETSNIKEWDSETEDLETSLFDFVDNLKSDRTSLDIVYEVLLKYGLPLDSKIKDMGKFYSVAGGTLRINLDKVIDDATIKAICDDYRNTLEIDEDHKTTVVLRETSFRDSVEKTNKKHELEKAGIKEIIIL